MPTSIPSTLLHSSRLSSPSQSFAPLIAPKAPVVCDGHHRPWSLRPPLHGLMTEFGCRVLALLRHANGLQGCLLIGAHRKWATDYQTDAIDPKRTKIAFVYVGSRVTCEALWVRGVLDHSPTTRLPSSSTCCERLPHERLRRFCARSLEPQQANTLTSTMAARVGLPVRWSLLHLVMATTPSCSMTTFLISRESSGQTKSTGCSRWKCCSGLLIAIIPSCRASGMRAAMGRSSTRPLSIYASDCRPQVRARASCPSQDQAT